MGLSLDQLEDKTRIKKEFLKTIEAEEWKKLPEYPVVSGFVKSIASALDVEKEKAVALLRRDYPPKDLPINPKKVEVKEKFRWNPKATFIAGIAIVALVVAGYLVYQYQEFTSPPDLEVYSIELSDNMDNEVLVRGATDPDTTLTINNTPIRLSEDGGFEANLNLEEDEQGLTIVAVSRSGKRTEETVNVEK